MSHIELSDAEKKALLARIKSLTEDIEEMYPSYTRMQKDVSTLKEALKFHFDTLTKENDAHQLFFQGLRLHYKRKPTYTWKQEALNEELEDVGGVYALAMAKKNDKHTNKFLQVLLPNEDGETVPQPLSVLAMAPERYVRPFPKRRPKEIVEKEKAELQDLLDMWKETPTEDIVTLFKLKKLDLQSLTNTYDQLKSELLHVMKEANVSTVTSEMGSLKALDKDPVYDITAFMGHTFVKQLIYHVRYLHGQLEVTDLFTKETIVTQENAFALGGHTLTFSEHGFFVDDRLVNATTYEKIQQMAQVWETDKNAPPLLLTIETEVDSDTLIRQLPFSTANVEALIDDGMLHPKTLERFRFIEDAKDLNTSFEAVEEDTHNARIEMFMRKNSRRAQQLRYMQETAKNVLKDA